MKWYFYFFEIRRIHTKIVDLYPNDAFDVILKSNFDFKQQKMEKIDILIHSLLFSTLKYEFFQVFPV